MKKVFKDYLEIYVGSRGLIEDVSIKSFENIEDYLEFKSDENKESMEGFNEFESKEEEEEYLGYWDWNKSDDIEGEYYLGLGDEECKYYIDMKSKKFLDWKEKNSINVEYGVSNIDSNIIRELL
jgi:hypothetical protein